MSDITDPNDDTQYDADGNPIEPEPEEKPTRAAKQAREARLELAQARRELAMIRCGIDTTTPIGGLVMRGYEGDIADTDALKTFATEVGALKAADPEPEPETPAEPGPTISDETKASTDERRELAGEGTTADGEGVSHRDSSLAAGRAEMERGGNETKALAAMLHERVAAANAGDTSVIVGGGAVVLE